MLLDNVWVIYRSDSKIAKGKSIDCANRLNNLGAKVINLMLEIEEDKLPNLIKTYELPSLAIVLGGDGTVLRAASRLAIHNIPILSFNVGGNLGFLTHDQSLLDSENLWEQLYANQFSITPRMMLHANLFSQLNSESRHYSYWSLNDLYFRSYRDEISPTCNLELEIDGERVDEYRGDGLIVSTPTGSTAYAMAAGGPILHPEIDAIVVSAICPMSLSSRPIVIPGNSKLVINALGDQNSKIKLWQDGASGALIQSGDKCIIKKAQHQAQMVVLEDSPSYYRTLTQKLHWAGSLVNSSKNKK